MSIKPQFSRHRRCRATTLVEFMFAITIGGIVASALAAMSLYGAQSLASLSNYMDMGDRSRRTFDQLSRDVRNALAVTAITTNRLTLRSATGSTIVYDYSKTGRTLDRLDGSWKTVLKECDALTFALERPDTSSATNYHKFLAATGTNGQVLSVNWTCTRSRFGRKVNTDQLQSAKIVIRNAP